MVARPFRHEADNRRINFEVQSDPHLSRSLVTDSKRLQQVLKNLLSNAFKFTEQGGVKLAVSAKASGWSSDHPILGAAASGIPFEVSGTRSAIPPPQPPIPSQASQHSTPSTPRQHGTTP